MEVIYTVTSVQILPTKHDSRCWTWFKTLEEAQKIIEEESGEFFYEYYYNYMVIEETASGRISSIYKEWWYKWNDTDSKWEVCEKPEPNIIHYGIG